MRRAALVALIALGCQGESVSPNTVDGGVDATTDSTVSGCVPANNLVPAGEFAKGASSWIVEPSCTVAFVNAPCGKAMHVSNLTKECGIRVLIADVKVSAGTNLRGRAKFKKGAAAPDYAPRIIFRSYGPGPDGGEVLEDYAFTGVLGADWAERDALFTLKSEQTGLEVIIYDFVDPGTTPPRDFYIADLSLVKE